MLAPTEGAPSDGGYAFRQFKTFEGFAVFECKGTDCSQALGKFLECYLSAIRECVVANLGDSVRECDGGEVVASPKKPERNRRNFGRNGDLLQAATILERFLSNVGHRIRDDDAFELAAS